MGGLPKVLALAAAAMCCIIAAATTSGMIGGVSRATELLSHHSRRRTAIRASKEGYSLPEAREARQAINGLIMQLTRQGASTASSQRMLKDATGTLKEVAKLEGNIPVANLLANAGDTLEGDADMKIPSDLPLQDETAVHSELSKLRRTARNLRREMEHVKQEDDYPSVVSSASSRVVKDGSELQSANRDEFFSRHRIVQHELDVARKRLADAEEKEEAAARAKAVADSAEKLAAEKHDEAAMDMKDAAEGRLAARRARRLAKEGASGVMGLEKLAPKLPKLTVSANERETEKTCTDVISVLGCARLPKGTSCAQFCGAASKLKKVHAKHLSSVGHGSKKQTSYVDDVYGGKYDASTYKHERTGFFVKQPASQASDQDAADVDALSKMEYSRGGDVASNGRDMGQVQDNSHLVMAGDVLVHEREVQNRLSRALEREQAENEVLKSRLRGRGLAGPREASPPLPRYAAKGTQSLAELGAGGTRAVVRGGMGDQANKEEEQVHRRAAKTSDGSLFDPFRP